MITVPVSPMEYVWAEKLAEIRNDKAEHTNRKFTGRHSNFDIHLMGILGEMAFSKMSGLQLDTTKRLNGDTSDFIYQQCKIEIKTRGISDHVPTPDLLVRPQYAHSHLYVLAWWNKRDHLKVNLIGYCAQERLIKNVTHATGHVRYIVNHGELSPIDKLIDRIRAVKMDGKHVEATRT